MNIEQALKNAKEFIDFNLGQNRISNFNLNEPIIYVASKKILEDDPDLKIFKSKLNKIGYQISSTEQSNKFTINKIL